MSISTLFDIHDKVAFVTGAGSGLGRAIAEVLAEAGARLVLFDADKAGLQETAEELRRFAGEPLIIQGDVRDETAVDAAFAACAARFGRLDILFNNAGIGDPVKAKLHDYETQNWQKVMDINLQGVFFCARAALRLMERQGSGKIINMASMWGLVGPSPVSVSPAYAASKAAVINLTREIALQYAENNIQANVICPGFFRTKLGRFENPAALERMKAFTPLRRIAEPQEIKGLALYLASSASDFMTGATLVIDGGCLAR